MLQKSQEVCQVKDESQSISKWWNLKTQSRILKSSKYELNTSKTVLRINADDWKLKVIKRLSSLNYLIRLRIWEMFSDGFSFEKPLVEIRL